MDGPAKTCLTEDDGGSSSNPQEEVGDSEGKASDGELDDSVYDVVDDLFFKAIKPGPRRKFNGSWRDKTYIRLYGCASYYIGWNFRNVATKVDYRIQYVVSNVHTDNSGSDFYFKCSRIGSCSSSDSSFEYVKCVELMTTQRKHRLYEWINRSSSSRKYTRKKLKQRWPGWAIVDDGTIPPHLV